MRPPVFLLPFLALSIVLSPGPGHAQEAPYDDPPPAEPPYYRVRYEAAPEPGGLAFPLQYTVWIPQGVETLRCVVVHQHGCGEGSCKSGLPGVHASPCFAESQSSYSYSYSYSILGERRS